MMLCNNYNLATSILIDWNFIVATICGRVLKTYKENYPFNALVQNLIVSCTCQFLKVPAHKLSSILLNVNKAMLIILSVTLFLEKIFIAILAFLLTFIHNVQLTNQ